MGDRGNVIFRYEDGSKIYFYTHWSGSSLKETTRQALIRGKDRWDDPPYLSRIVFCQMLIDAGATLEDTTGFGISTEECDNENDLVTVDTKAKTVNGIPFATYIKSPRD